MNRIICTALTAGILLSGFSGTRAHAQQPPVSQPVQTIDLATALRLAGLNNLDLALVRQAQRQAKATNDAATLKFVPAFSVGEAVARTAGSVQQTAGEMESVNKQLYGRGATIGMSVEVGDAIFNKLAARQLQIAAGHAVESQRNDTLLTAANAYFDLVDAVAERDIAAESLRVSRDYQSLLEQAATAGLADRSEALRVAVRTQQARLALRGAQGRVSVSAANLDVVLRLDPSIVLTPSERLVVPPMLVPLDTPLPQLIQAALRSRPELKASAAAVAAAEHQLTAAKYGPLIPSVGAMAVYGQSRGGADGALDDYEPTHNFAFGLSWRFGPGGLFDFSRTEAADSHLDREQIGDEKLRLAITRQVVVTLGGARAAHEEMLMARQGIDLARRSLQLSMQRRHFGVSDITEVIEAEEDFTRSRSGYAEALARYAKAQYALARAIGRLGD